MPAPNSIISSYHTPSGGLLEQMGRHLGVSSEVAKRAAMLLGLPLHRAGRNIAPAKIAAFEGRTKLPARTKLETYKKEWLVIVNTHQEDSRSSLYTKFQRVYDYLLSYAPDWLNEHLPPPQRPKSGLRTVDWTTRDEEIEEAVSASALRLRSRPGLPARITETAIFREADLPRLTAQAKNKLPLTVQALAQVVETREQAAIRRLEWTAEQYFQEGVHPTRYQLAERAQIRETLPLSALVGELLEDSLRRLNHT